MASFNNPGDPNSLSAESLALTRLLRQVIEVNTANTIAAISDIERGRFTVDYIAAITHTAIIALAIKCLAMNLGEQFASNFAKEHSVEIYKKLLEKKNQQGD